MLVTGMRSSLWSMWQLLCLSAKKKVAKVSGLVAHRAAVMPASQFREGASRSGKKLERRLLLSH